LFFWEKPVDLRGIFWHIINMKENLVERFTSNDKQKFETTSYLAAVSGRLQAYSEGLVKEDLNLVTPEFFAQQLNEIVSSLNEARHLLNESRNYSVKLK